MRANTKACLLDRGRPEGLMLPAGQLALAYPRSRLSRNDNLFSFHAFCLDFELRPYFGGTASTTK